MMKRFILIVGLLIVALDTFADDLYKPSRESDEFEAQINDAIGVGDNVSDATSILATFLFRCLNHTDEDNITCIRREDEGDHTFYWIIFLSVNGKTINEIRSNVDISAKN